MTKPLVLTKNRTVEYILPDNRKDEPEDQVRFKLRTLPFTVRMDILNALVIDPDGGVRADVSRRIKLACKHGLAGWSDNFVDVDGKTIEWSAAPKKMHGVEVIDDDLLSLLPDDVLTDIGNAVNDLSTSAANEVGK